MSPAGYSGTPLPGKLGIKPDHTIALLATPDGFDATLGALPPGVTVRHRAQGNADVVVTFHTDRTELESRVATLLRVLDVDGSLWVAWPKRASRVPTDITEDGLREVFLPLGMVDNKVCAIDETWSGLRLVWRTELRAQRRGSSPASRASKISRAPRS
jgi:hypothetical protein